MSIFEIKNIKQIMPADGWWECSENIPLGEETPEKYMFKRLVCWALVEGIYEGNSATLQRVIGLTHDPLDEREESMRFGFMNTGYKDFPKYVREEDFEILGRRLKEDRDPEIFG